MKQDFEKTRRTQYTFSDDGLKNHLWLILSKLIRGNRYLHFFPPYILLLFIPALVKHTRVWSNWVNGVCSENKGADQLRGYHEADLRLCFWICKKQFFSWLGSNIDCHMSHA